MHRALAVASLVVLIAAAPPASHRPAPDSAVLAQAEEAFGGERYTDALELYDRLRDRYPDAPEIPYNMGIAAYRGGDLDRAAELFNEALRLGGDPDLRSRSAYNLGTTAFRRALEPTPQPLSESMTQLDDATQDLLASLRHYRDALDANPGDLDAQANGELAQRWLEQLEQMKQQLEQQQQQQQEQPDQQEQQERDPDQDQENPQQSQSQENSEQGQDEQQQQQPQAEPEEGEQEQQAQPSESGEEQPDQEQQTEQPSAGEEAQEKPMSREEAERLLQGVRDKEQQRRRDLARQEALQQPPVDKDW